MGTILAYLNDTALMVVTQSKTQKLTDKVIKESESKRLTTVCEKKVCMIVSKRDISREELRIGDVKIKPV